MIMSIFKKTTFGLAAISVIMGLTGLALLQSGCGPDPKTEEDDGPKQLNISILLDLSDRIDSVKHPSSPSHVSRDLTIVNHIAGLFRTEMDRLGAFDANGKIQVFFLPPPPIANIDNLQNNLKVNLSNMDVQQKKTAYDNILSDFQSSLEEIYSETIKHKKYTTGSDIWRFFKNDVVNYCIDKDTNYRNILVIITDGYIYDAATMEKNGNRVTNLTVGRFGKYRNCPDPIAAIKKDDFGLMVPRSDLQNLEVLILEVSPENNSLKDEDILTYCLDHWMDEMGVSRHAVYKTDLPSNTAKRIDNFFDLQ